MWDIAAICGIVTSSVVAIGMAMFLICIVINSYVEASQARKNDTTRNRLHSELNQLDRWLCYDFPIVEELTDYLRERINESPRICINEFREGLREKYGTRQSQEQSE